MRSIARFFCGKPGWFFPILGNVNEAGNQKNVLYSNGLWKKNQEKGLEFLASCGVITFQGQHGYQVQRDDWSRFLQ
jgi:hypothetical protein